MDKKSHKLSTVAEDTAQTNPVPACDNVSNVRSNHRQMLAAGVLPCVTLLAIRCMEAGLDRYVSAALACMAILSLLNLACIDALLWRWLFEDDYVEMRALRAARWAERCDAGNQAVAGLLLLAVGYHSSRGDYSGAAAPAVISFLLFQLPPRSRSFVNWFINGCAFEYFCFEKGGGDDEAFLWSPVLFLTFWNLVVVESATQHLALDLWKLAAVTRFCHARELSLAVAGLAALAAAGRVVEAQWDQSHIQGRRLERCINDCIDADRKQLIGVLSHEFRNRLDILTNLVTESTGTAEGSSQFRQRPRPRPLETASFSVPQASKFRKRPKVLSRGSDGSDSSDCSAPDETRVMGTPPPAGLRDTSVVVQQSALMQQTVSVVLDLLDIEKPVEWLSVEEHESARREHLRRLQQPPSPKPSPSDPGAQLEDRQPMVRVHLGLVVHSAQQLQLEALQHYPAVNTAARFTMDLDPRLEGDVMTSKLRLHWILCHLIANAYGGCGTGPEASVRVHISPASSDTLDVQVTNAGAVHEQSLLDLALASHSQTKHSHTWRWNGHGLGLRHTAAMLRLLQQPPLQLRAAGASVTASFTIPYAACTPPPSPPPRPLRPPWHGAPQQTSTSASVDANARAAGEGEGKAEGPVVRHVMVVDDECVIRMLAQRSLEKTLGCTVITAENGLQGVKVFQQRRQEEASEFDVILMDVQMPVLSGDEAVRHIRRLELQYGWPHTCIFARTANTSRSDCAHYKKCGMDGCLSKAGNVVTQMCQALVKKRQCPSEFAVIGGEDGV